VDSLGNPDELSRIFKINQVEVVVYCAWAGGPRNEVEHPGPDVVDPFTASIQSAVDSGVSRFVFMSSGGAECEDPREKTQYGKLKLLCDQIGFFKTKNTMCSFISIKPSAVYGETVSGTLQTGAVNAVLKCALTNQTFQLFGDGGSKRDYLYIEDLCDVITLALTTSRTEIRVGGPELLSLHQLIDLASRVFGTKLQVDSIGNSDPGPPEISLHDPSFLESSGWTAQWCVAEYFEKFVR
jgi:nucleoside-diphosphate-sugar epimerase